MTKTAPELDYLELQVENLLKTREQLKNENISLRQKLLKLTQERAKLLETKQKAATMIKRIIMQLRNDVQ